MTTNDPFTTAARAEANLRWPARPGQAPDLVGYGKAVGFEAGASWARSYLAEQEPTDAEVQAAAEAIADAAEGIEEWDSLTSSEQRAYRSEARAALSAARAALAEGGDER